MAEARITLTVTRDDTAGPLLDEHLGVLGAAACEGFKVDGWAVTNTRVENVTEALEVGTRVRFTGDTAGWDVGLEAGTEGVIEGVLDDQDVRGYPGGFDYGYSIVVDDDEFWDVAPTDVTPL